MMRKWIPLALCLTFSAAASGQLQKDQFLFGVDAGVAGMLNPPDSFDVPLKYTAALNYAYLISDRLGAGLRIEVGKYLGRRLPFGETSLIVGIGPLARYYLLPPANQVNAFLEGAYTFNRIRSDINFGRYTFTSHSFSVRGGPALFLRPGLALEAGIGYTGTVSRGSSAVAHDLTGNIGFRLHIGN